MSFKTEVKTQWHGREVKVRGREVVGKSAYEIGLVVEGQAKLLCAKRYGYLAASINTQSRDQGTEVESAEKYRVAKIESNIINSAQKAAGAFSSLLIDKIKKPSDDIDTYVGTNVFYGPYVEFGTSKMSAQPFLRPAFELAKGHTLTIVKLNGKMHFKEYLTETDQFKYRNQ